MKRKLLFLVAIVMLAGSSANAQIRMVFRYDDYLLTPSSLNDSLFYVFRKNHIPLCIGIIPFDEKNNPIYSFTDEKLQDLKNRINNHEIEIALHGYNHMNNVSPSFLTKYVASEFASLNYHLQAEKITRGKRFLDSLLQIDTKVFIPPFNTYDKNTVKALESMRFKILSASMKCVTPGNGIDYMPGTFVDFVDLPALVKRYKGQDVIIILYFHPFSFPGGNPKYPNDLTKQVTISQLDTILSWINSQGVKSYTFSELSGMAEFNRGLYLSNTAKYNLLKKILYKYRGFNNGIYRIENNTRGTALLLAGNVLLHIISFLIVYFVILYFCRIFKAGQIVVRTFLFLVTLAGIIFFYYHRYDFSFLIMLLFFAINCIAVILALSESSRSKRRLAGK